MSHVHILLFIYDRVKNRSITRSLKPQNGAMGQVEKIGYIPRGQVPVLQDTGLSTNKNKGEELDDESSAGLARMKEKDAEIDSSLGDVLRIVDNLGDLAIAMNEEVTMKMITVSIILYS